MNAKQEDKTRENALVAAAKTGDVTAYQQLVTPCGPALRYVCYVKFHFDHETAEDVGQQAWKQGWENIGGFRGDSAFHTWFVRIVFACCSELLRRGKTQKRGEGNTDSLSEEISDQLAEHGPSPFDELLAKERKIALHKAIKMLPPKEKETILAIFEGDTISEISQARTITKDTVKTQRANGYATLKRILTGL